MDDYGEQIEELALTLSHGWYTTPSRKSGNPVYKRPSVIVMYREDQKFLLDAVIPHSERTFENYDSIVASQSWRLACVGAL